MNSLLSTRHLNVSLGSAEGMRPVLRDVNFDIGESESVAIVGESGSGKSMILRAIMQLLPPGAEMSGEIRFQDQLVNRLDRQELRRLRTGSIGIIFQDPRAHINPVRTVGDFLTESLIASRSMKPRLARKLMTDLLDDVGVSRAAARLAQYPWELSGGLLQRVMIASVVAMKPKLILADEPTTALDVTTQADVMRLLIDLRREYGMSLAFVSHDLDLAAAVCDRTVVLYAGNVMEDQDSASLHTDPLHPYTSALGQARPNLHSSVKRLRTIPGKPMSATEERAGCPFKPRCRFARDECLEAPMSLLPVGLGHTACIRIDAVRSELGNEEDAE